VPINLKRKRNITAEEKQMKKTCLVVAMALILGSIVFLDHTSTLKKEHNEAKNILELKAVEIYQRPIIDKRRWCGDSVCDYHIGETPLSCPEDCFVKSSFFLF